MIISSRFILRDVTFIATRIKQINHIINKSFIIINQHHTNFINHTIIRKKLSLNYIFLQKIENSSLHILERGDKKSSHIKGWIYREIFNSFVRFRLVAISSVDHTKKFIWPIWLFSFLSQNKSIFYSFSFYEISLEGNIFLIRSFFSV